MEITTRRKLLLLGTTALVGVGMGGTTQCSGSTIVTTVTQLIQSIQEKVVAALKTACSTASAIVPTADTVLTVLEALLGTTLMEANIAAGIAQIQAAVDAIVAAGCPTPAPTPPVFTTPKPATVNGKSVVVNFY